MAPVGIAPNVRGTPEDRQRTSATPTTSAAAFGGELARQMNVGPLVATSPANAPVGNGVDRKSEAAATRTPLTGSEAASALSSAWRKVTGQQANPKLLSVLVAQWSHETGRGESMLNYNFGGIKGTSPAGLSAAYKTHEGSGATKRVTTDHFRAYGSASEGAEDYVRLLRARFPSALDAAQTGNASGFVHELKRSGYFTDNEADYARSVSTLASRAERDGFDSIGADRSGPLPAIPVFPSLDGASGLAIASMAQGGSFPIDSGALADEIAQAAIRIAHSTTEDYLHEIERLDTPRTT